tara:strand:+ start:15855 stop:16370 length:516 start_codon:yes stop_codon:yes gene_type:complete
MVCQTGQHRKLMIQSPTMKADRQHDRRGDRPQRLVEIGGLLLSYRVQSIRGQRAALTLAEAVEVADDGPRRQVAGPREVSAAIRRDQGRLGQPFVIEQIGKVAAGGRVGCCAKQDNNARMGHYLFRFQWHSLHKTAEMIVVDSGPKWTDTMKLSQNETTRSLDSNLLGRMV